MSAREISERRKRERKIRLYLRCVLTMREREREMHVYIKTFLNYDVESRYRR